MNPEPPDILKKIIRHKALEIGERSTRISLKEMSVRAERGPAVRPFSDMAKVVSSARTTTIDPSVPYTSISPWKIG